MIFVDTGPFLARYIQRDQYHERAVNAWKELASRSWRCFTSNFVLDETFTLLARKTSHKFAAERARVIMLSNSLEVLRPTADDELRALEFFEKFADQKMSFTDCISFSLMKENALHQCFSFDRHFEHAGFTLWPQA